MKLKPVPRKGRTERCRSCWIRTDTRLLDFHGICQYCCDRGEAAARARAAIRANVSGRP